MRHDDPGDRELRARLSELADAAAHAAAVPAAAGARRRRGRGRTARRATAALAVLLGALAGPAAVGAGLASFSADGDSRPARTSSPTAPPAGRILPPAPPGVPVEPGQPPWTPAQPSLDPRDPSRPPGATPTATRVPPATPPQRIWLSDGGGRDGAGCARPAPVDRTIDGYYPALQALRLVLAGPGPDETARGLRSAAAVAGLTIRGYSVVGRTARVDFNPPSEGAVLPPRPCRAVELIQPLERTLTQFPNISDVRYSIKGSEPAFYRELIGIDVPDR